MNESNEDKERIQLLFNFAQVFSESQIPLDPEFAKILDIHFWELI